MTQPPTFPASLPAPPVPSVPRLTVEEFLARYRGTNAELVKGVVKEYPMPGFKHGVICLRIGRLIGFFVEANNLGEVASNDSWIRTGSDSVRGGDICFIRRESLPEGGLPEGPLSVPPDLVVEVKSPSDRWGELFEKVGEYLKIGVRVVVIVDPAGESVPVYRDAGQQILKPGEELTLADVLPGFSVPVARLLG